MSEFRDDIKKHLLDKRNLTPSTLKTYTSILFSLIKKTELPQEMKSFEKTDVILKHISENPMPQSRKTALSALFVLTGNLEYGAQMSKDIKIVNDDYKKKVMSPERKEKMLNPEQLKEKNDALIAKYKKDKTKDSLNDVVISVLMSGVYFPPRRLEYALVKTRDFDKEKDNYIIKNKIYLNQYKTSAKYGMQTVIIPKEIMPFITKAGKENQSGYLLEAKGGKPYSSSSLSKKLTAVFGLGIDLIRSSYINHVIYEDGLFKKMEKTAEAMGNSIESQQNFYVKGNA
jgi:hypothetical protein